jgi:hypothetical protein
MLARRESSRARESASQFALDSRMRNALASVHAAPGRAHFECGESCCVFQRTRESHKLTDTLRFGKANLIGQRRIEQTDRARIYSPETEKTCNKTYLCESVGFAECD